ncbi:MAG: hypothetical protein B7Z47_00450 [Chthoniobacter sp. 12-60-6]|nr:MAG: hypothetical protein B7Z47_00450 [Chthoniobacter sp. 12-60-6]
MNERNPGSLFIVFLLMFFGLYAVVSVVLTEGNSIGQMCQFLMVAGFLMSLIVPRLGFFIWIVFCGYNDLLKRLLVVGGRVSHNDLMWVLGITPAMFAGIVVSLAIGGLLGSRRIQGREWLLLLIGLILMLGAGVLAAKQDGGGMGAVLQGIANNGLYTLLLFVVPVLLKNKGDVAVVWRCLVIAFLPVSIYGVVQQINGFTDFEVEYLRTGLSIELKQLFAGEVRAFSTLNSPTSLSVVCAALAVFSLILGFSRRDPGNPVRMGRVLALICFVIHLAGMIASTSRSAFLMLPVGLIGARCFAQPGRTRVFYISVISAFLLLIASSVWLINNLEQVNEVALSLGGPGAFISRMLVVGTYWDRLSGFSTVLTNPKAWSLFGYGKLEDGTGMYYYHDPISAILMQYGVIVLILVFVTLVLMLRWFHRQAWRMESNEDRHFASAMIAVGFSILLVSALSGSVMAVFPVNIFFWLACAGVLGLAKRPDPSTGPQRAPVQQPLPQGGRFAPNQARLHQ